MPILRIANSVKFAERSLLIRNFSRTRVVSSGQTIDRWAAWRVASAQLNAYASLGARRVIPTE
jgi:hypothetical protein